MEGLNGDLKRAETVLRGHRIKLRRKSEIAKQIKTLKNKKKRGNASIVSLDTIFKRSKKIDLDLKRTKRRDKIEKKEVGKEVKPASYSLLFVVRNYKSAESHVSKEHLQELGLSRVNSGRLMTNSVDNLKLLKRVFPFVYYGSINLKNLKTLLHKRGTVYNNGVQLIKSNVVVEDNFKHLDIYSLNELIDHIYKGLNNCEDILLKLGPINLSQLDQYVKHFDNGNKYGPMDINSILNNIN